MSIMGKLKGSALYELIQVMRCWLGYNRPFDDLPMRKQRMAIIQDGLNMLEAKRLEAYAGHYVLLEHGVLQEGHMSMQLCDVLREVPRCQVCELGMMFVSAVDRADELLTNKVLDSKYDRTVRGYDVRDYLKRWFSDSEMTMMEAAFEGWDVEVGNSSELLPFGFSAFYEVYADPLERMRMVSENFLTNGTFVPMLLPHVFEQDPEAEYTRAMKEIPF